VSGDNDTFRGDFAVGKCEGRYRRQNVLAKVCARKFGDETNGPVTRTKGRGKGFFDVFCATPESQFRCFGDSRHSAGEGCEQQHARLRRTLS
jgi:hypothetical protein